MEHDFGNRQREQAGGGAGSDDYAWPLNQENPRELSGQHNPAPSVPSGDVSHGIEPMIWHLFRVSGMHADERNI